MKQNLQNIIHGLRKNDQKAFDHLFDLYHKKIFYFCLQQGLDTVGAEEVVQEVFVKIWNSRKHIEPKGNIQGYIYMIAKNVILDEFKKRIKRRAAENYQLHLLQSTNNTQEKVAYNELKEMIAKILVTMPEKRRLVFELSRFKGLSNKEIANEMGIAVKTVEAHLTQAIQNFKEVFKRSEIITVSFFLQLASIF